MKYDNQLRYAINIIKEYDGRHPLAAWLKDFFRENKQMGSRDRKTVSELVYGYFRLGHNQYASVEERMLTGLFAGDNLPELTTYFKSAEESLPAVSIDKIFPWSNLLSEEIDAPSFAASFLKQPDLFIKIRPGKKDQVTGKLDAAGITYKISGDCIALPNSTKAAALLKINEEAVIQDKSSQRTGLLVRNLTVKTVWDCCAASGGKSIMLFDLLPWVELTVSDVRASVINNLKDRFREASIRDYDAFVTDLSVDHAGLPEKEFDLIVADVPCTGSGTWSRTPEQLLFFRKKKINYYTGLQKKIIDKSLTRLKPGGHYLYITCSVFREENEKMTAYLQTEKQLQLVEQKLIKGYEEKADTLFAALFTDTRGR